METTDVSPVTDHLVMNSCESEQLRGSPGAPSCNTATGRCVFNSVRQFQLNHSKNLIISHYSVNSISSLGYLLIYPPQIATVTKLISFCSKYNPVSHTKSLGESQEWNMFFQGNIWSRVKAFKTINGFAHFWLQKVYSALDNRHII